MYKMLIIDDEPLVQIGIRSMLPWENLGISICGLAGNGQIGWSIIEKEHPDIVITDLKMPVMSGLDLIKKSRQTYGNAYPVFIVLTSYEEFQLAKEAITYQVIDYLVKIELTADVLKTSIEKAVQALKNLAPSGNNTSLSADMTQNDIQSLQDKFFIRLLHNLYDSADQFELLRKDLSIPFDFTCFQCCYFEMINPKADSLLLDKQVTLYFNSFHLLKEITDKYQHAYFVTLDRKHGVILFLYDSNAPKRTTTELKQMLLRISDNLTGYYNTYLHCGIGSVVSDPLSISDSYMAARLAYRQTSECSPVSCLDDLPDGSMKHSIFNISIWKNELSKAFSEYDAVLLSDSLNQIITLFKEHPANYVQALDAACNILFLSISLLPHGEECLNEMFQDVPEGCRSIYQQNTTFEVVFWMESFRDRMCNMFASHKREHRHHVVDSVKKYIETHLDDRLNLNEVSALYGISSNYLSSLFKKYNNCGYSEYITDRKIAKAKEMMKTGNKKVYEISDALGFESAFYFSKVFKKVEGISPTEYMNRYQ